MADAVEVTKALDGGFFVTRYCETEGETFRALSVLLAINSAAFDVMREKVLGPPAFPPRSYGDDLPDTVGVEAPELSPEQEARFDAANPPEPIDVLNVEKASGT